MTKRLAGHLLPVTADDTSLVPAGHKRRQAPDELVRVGTLVRAAPSVFLLPKATLAARPHAAAEHAGPDAVITGWAACMMYGFRYVEDRGAIPVLIPHRRPRVSTQHVTIMRTRRMPETRSTATSILVAAPVRALVDLGRA